MSSLQIMLICIFILIRDLLLALPFRSGDGVFVYYVTFVCWHCSNNLYSEVNDGTVSSSVVALFGITGPSFCGCSEASLVSSGNLSGPCLAFLKEGLLLHLRRHAVFSATRHSVPHRWAKNMLHEWMIQLLMNFLYTCVYLIFSLGHLDKCVSAPLLLQSNMANN